MSEQLLRDQHATVTMPTSHQKVLRAMRRRSRLRDGRAPSLMEWGIDHRVSAAEPVSNLDLGAEIPPW